MTASLALGCASRLAVLVIAEGRGWLFVDQTYTLRFVSWLSRLGWSWKMDRKLVYVGESMRLPVFPARVTL